MIVRDNLENMCMYKIQLDKRLSRGHIGTESKCYHCKGYNLYCDDYVPLVCQKEVEYALSNSITENWGGELGI